MKRENKNAILGVILAVSLAFSSAGVAYAISISGTVYYGLFQGFNNAKVTAERSLDYRWTRSSSSGAYSVTTGTSMWYTVSAMSGGWTHNAVSQINGGSTGVNHVLSTRPAETINVRIVADEEYRNAHGWDWPVDAEAKLRAAEPWFFEEHSIQFVDDSYDVWITEGQWNQCVTYMTDVKEDLDWPNSAGSADLLWAITSQASAAPWHGCTENKGSPPYDPLVTIIRNGAPQQDTLVMHEMTHVYGYHHQCGAVQWYDIMESDIVDGACAAADPTLQIKNWKPGASTTGDVVMEAHRNWY